MQLASVAPSAPVRSARPVSPSLGTDTTTAVHQRNAGEDLSKYYATAQGKEGAELLRALHLIVRTGHVDRGYSQARDELFGDVADLDGDDRIEDLFTGELRGPITDRKNGFDKGFNTEHTWPQSKGATGIAQSDLHHLHPSNITTNERRGSLPYGDVVSADWSVGEGARQAKRGVDELGKTVFEPRQDIKGDIARGLLYFYTRYAQSRPSEFTLENFRHELPTLLKWHKADPVTELERQRNEAVQQVQGNRNPFVDRPEFVDLVKFGTLELGSRLTDPTMRSRLRGGVLLVVVAVVLGATITYGGDPAVDGTLVRDAADLRDGAFGTLMVWLSDVGYALWLVPLALVWALVLGLGLNRWRDALLVAFATPVAAVVTRVLKETFERTRPEGYDPLVAGFSIPSGHATSSAAFVVSVVLATHPGPRRTALAVVGVAFALLVSLSRVVLGVHYPSDVVAGLCGGAGVALLVSVAVSRYPRRIVAS